MIRFSVACCILWTSLCHGADLPYAPAPADNPLKGLVPYAGRGTDASGNPRFPHSIEFNYLPLADLMTGPDSFQWEPLERLLESVAARGNQAIFRVYIEYPGKTNGIPAFLRRSGLTIHTYTNTNTQPLPPNIVETPDYENPALRSALVRFIHELGRRYDGDPRIGFITAGLLGTWGEWHTYPRDELWASKAIQRAVLDAYGIAFRRTPILLRYPAGPNDPRYAQNHERGFGYHDDSFAWATVETGRRPDDWFFVPRLRSARALGKWRSHPIGGEIRPEVWGCVFDPQPCTPPGQEFETCVQATHVSWLMDSGMFKEASLERRNRAIDHVRRMGYELWVKQASLTVEPGVITATVTVTNTGVAPLYHRWPVELALVTADAVLKVSTTDWELTRIVPGEGDVTFVHRIAAGETIAEGTFVLMRVVNPLENGKPLRFANASQDSLKSGWLTLGRPTKIP